MSRKNVQMRGLKVCVIGCSDRDNHHLAQQFSRIGIEGLFCTVFPDESQLADQRLPPYRADGSRSEPAADRKRYADWPGG
ncbi:hypothetical protein S7A_11330 [Pantoea sp. Sc1]|nr:hypothetical protein S7A_11330 [Pantoea sp. Sc1]